LVEEQKKLDNFGHQTPQVFSFYIISFCIFYYFLNEEFVVIGQFLGINRETSMVRKVNQGRREAGLGRYKNSALLPIVTIT
jgi:hypothetical protein